MPKVLFFLNVRHVARRVAISRIRLSTYITESRLHKTPREKRISICNLYIHVRAKTLETNFIITCVANIKT